MRVRRIAGVFSVLLLVFAAAGCGHVRSGRGHRAGTVIQASAQASATLPEGYGPIMSLAGDPGGSGVWFWDSTTSDVSVFHVAGQGTLASWPVLSGAAYQSQVISGFAVTSAGVACLGINSTLLRLDSNSGAVQTWKIPAPADNPAAESYLPANLKGQHLVQGIAVAPDGGQVAIAMSHSSSVELFDQNAGTFTQVAMPASSDEPVSVAYAPDGSLGIGMANYKTHLQNTALIIGQEGAGSPTVVPVADSSSISSYGTSGFILGADLPDMVSTAGAATPIVLPSVPFNPPQSGPAISVMPNGNLAAIARSAVVEFPSNASSTASATAASVTLALPTQTCKPDVVDDDSPQPAPSGQCPTDANAMTVDNEGGVWVVPATGSDTDVERIST